MQAGTATMGRRGDEMDAPDRDEQAGQLHTIVEGLREEVNAIQNHLLASKRVWYQDIPTIISVLSFLFSLSAAGVSFIRVQQQDRNERRAQLTAIIQHLNQIPIDNATALRNNANDPLTAKNISG